jgi:hypothetical protein
LPNAGVNKTVRKFYNLNKTIGTYEVGIGYWLVIDLFFNWSCFVSFSSKHLYFGTHNSGYLGWGLFNKLWFGSAKAMPDYY